MKAEPTEELVSLQACLKVGTSWMASNLLPFDSDKAEVIVSDPKRLRDPLDHVITVEGLCSLQFLWEEPLIWPLTPSKWSPGAPAFICQP